MISDLLRAFTRGCEMLELGILLLGAAVLALMVLTPVLRRPVPPRWTTMSLVAELITVGIVAGLALGGILTGVGVIDLMQHGIGLVHLALFIGASVLLAVVWRWVRGRPSAGPGAGGQLPTGAA
jgi:hypothetical protein